MNRSIRADAASHPGNLRPRNEDSLVQRPELGLWAVADGAGGHGAGDRASQAVVAALAGLAEATLAALRLALHTANAAMHAEGQREGQPLVSTVLAALVQGGSCHLLWAGDSRAYLLRDGRLQQLTRDHSLVQELLDAGAIGPDQAAAHPQAHVILRAMGAEPSLQLDELTLRPRPGDTLLLCTDGLYRELDEAALTARLASGADAAALVQAVLAGAARDNVTALRLVWPA